MQPPLVCVITKTKLLLACDSLVDGRVRLRMRTESMFGPRLWPRGVLQRCARLAAGEHADGEGATCVEMSHVESFATAVQA